MTASPAVRSLAHRYALPVAWALVVAIFGALEPETFLSTGNFRTIFGSQAVLVILTLGLLLPLTAGDYDLSVASVLGLSAMTVALLDTEHGLPIGAAVAVAIGAGALAGAVNGVLTVPLGLDPFIVTLGTATFIGGVTFWISDSRTIGGVSRDLTDRVVGTRLLGIPVGFYYGLALCAAVWWVLAHTPTGQRLLFVGRGREVARLSGVRVTRLRFGSFVAAGTISAVAGVAYAGTTGGADPSSSANFLLPAYAAAFLGATAITPGRFNAWGSLIAVYFLVTGITGLQLLGAQTFVQQLFYGGALVGAVLLGRLARR